MYISSIGQDSHRFEPESSQKPMRLGGVTIKGVPGLKGNSDADVVLHALCNAISGLSTVNVLGAVTDTMCNDGITDSAEYVKAALETLATTKLLHLSISIEAKRPHLSKYIPQMRSSIAALTALSSKHIGITATTGEALTAFGKGEGIQVFIIASAWLPDEVTSF